MNKKQIMVSAISGAVVGGLVIGAFHFVVPRPEFQRVTVRCPRHVVIKYRKDPSADPLPVECSPAWPFDIRSNHGGEIILP